MLKIKCDVNQQDLITLSNLSNLNNFHPLEVVDRVKTFHTISRTLLGSEYICIKKLFHTKNIRIPISFENIKFAFL